MSFNPDQKKALKRLGLEVEEKERMSEDRYKATHAAIVRLLTALGVDQKDANYKETPRRITEWLLEKFPDRLEQDLLLKDFQRASFPSDYRGLVAQTKIRTNGLCPHHFLPVNYEVSIGYVPEGSVVGLSKLSRITNYCLGPAGVQEDLTYKLADILQQILRVSSVAVIVKGHHTCMSVRGVRQHEAKTTTSEMRGIFRNNSGGIKEEFLLLVNNGGSK